jgi:hypothetical protein
MQVGWIYLAIGGGLLRNIGRLRRRLKHHIEAAALPPKVRRVGLTAAAEINLSAVRRPLIKYLGGFAAT